MKEKHSRSGWQWVFEDIVDYLRKANLLFANLEGPISSKGYRTGSEFSFRFEPAVVDGLTYAGFDILSLANNHTLDYSRPAFEETMEILKGNKIEYLGAGLERDEAYQLKIIKRCGVRIGFLAYTNLGPRAWQAETGRPGLAWINYPAIKNVKDYISAIRDRVDILIVSLHSGREYVSEPTDFQKAFSRACIDAGADIVLGHHPHIVQALERYKQSWIAYSLGNFVFDQGFSEQTMEGRLLEIRIKNRKISSVLPHKVILNSFFQPRIGDNLTE